MTHDIAELSPVLPDVGGVPQIAAALWPAEPTYGIPLLRLDMQAQGLVPPFARWGRERRKSRMRGTWHFYTDDSRFSRLWSRPGDLLTSACAATVECNYSVSEDTPRAAALWAVYRKRWLARSWQERGVRILVDLYVAPRHAEDNLLGVPRGWRAYATRGSSRSVADLLAEVEVAEDHADGRINLVVYGGAQPIRDACRYQDWLWMPEESDVVRGRHGP